MSDKFNGFSQDEINKVLKKSKNNVASNNAMMQVLRNQPGIRRMPDKIYTQAEQLRKQPPPKKPQQQVSKKPIMEVDTKPKDADIKNEKVVEKEVIPEDSDVNLDRSMSKSLEEALFFQPQKKPTPPTIPNSENLKESNADNTASSSDSTDDSSILKLSAILATNSNGSDDSILPTAKVTPDVAQDENLNTDSPFKGISLKDFEHHRKMIQEQNNQKRELLYKAIEQHSQKTAAETRKIAEIKHELSKLENDLAVDVALLRKQIDNACINFANIEKHYMKIESQFLKAKMEYHQAAEKKELLTEHLCTVIAHNEDRKAQKLTELMQKVGLGTTDDYIPPTTAQN